MIRCDIPAKKYTVRQYQPTTIILNVSINLLSNICTVSKVYASVQATGFYISMRFVVALWINHMKLVRINFDIETGSSIADRFVAHISPGTHIYHILRSIAEPGP